MSSVCDSTLKLMTKIWLLVHVNHYHFISPSLPLHYTTHHFTYNTFFSIFNLSPFLLFIIYLFFYSPFYFKYLILPHFFIFHSPFILLHLFYSFTPLFSSLSNHLCCVLSFSSFFFSITSISSSLFSSFHNHLFSFSSSIILPPVYLFCLSLHLVTIFTVTYPLSSLSFLNSFTSPLGHSWIRKRKSSFRKTRKETSCWYQENGKKWTNGGC